MTRFFLSVAAVAAFLFSPVAMAQSGGCGGDTCSVGAFGTGGQKSDGKAQGFRDEFISTVRIPGAAITNSGNLNAGRFTVTREGSSLGTLSGTFRTHPKATARGRGTGMFGEWSGQCEEELLFDGC